MFIYDYCIESSHSRFISLLKLIKLREVVEENGNHFPWALPKAY